MDTNEVREILEVVASGVWEQWEDGVLGGSHSQCSYCRVGRHSEHAEWCPVRRSREILDRE